VEAEEEEATEEEATGEMTLAGTGEVRRTGEGRHPGGPDMRGQGPVTVSVAAPPPASVHPPGALPPDRAPGRHRRRLAATAKQKQQQLKYMLQLV